MASRCLDGALSYPTSVCPSGSILRSFAPTRGPGRWGIAVYQTQSKLQASRYAAEGHGSSTAQYLLYLVKMASSRHGCALLGDVTTPSRVYVFGTYLVLYSIHHQHRRWGRHSPFQQSNIMHLAWFGRMQSIPWYTRLSLASLVRPNQTGRVPETTVISLRRCRNITA